MNELVCSSSAYDAVPEVEVIEDFAVVPKP